LKRENTYNKPCFETAYLGESAINLLNQKVAQNVAIFRATLYFQKIEKASKSQEKRLNQVTLSST